MRERRWEVTRPDRPLYCLTNSRSDEQTADMIRLEQAGVCVFCPDNLDQPAVRRTGLWTVTPNEYPYANTRLHLLLIPDEHVEDLVDLSPGAWADLKPTLRWVRDHYGLTYYGLCSRNGDCLHTAGTICHVHVHVIVADGAVRFRVG